MGSSDIKMKLLRVITFLGLQGLVFVAAQENTECTDCPLHPWWLMFRGATVVFDGKTINGVYHKNAEKINNYTSWTNQKNGLILFYNDGNTSGRDSHGYNIGEYFKDGYADVIAFPERGGNKECTDGCSYV